MSFPVATFLPKRAINQWVRTRAKALMIEIDERSENGEEELLGLSATKGVLKKSDFTKRSAEADSYKGYKIVSPGDLISNKMQAWNGVFGISPEHGITSPDYALYRFQEGCVPKFIEYLVRTPLYAADFQSRSNGIGSGFMRLNPSDFLDTKFWLPCVDDQLAIVNYLDYETKRVDSLIEQKRRFVGLLKERRSALITKAVTRGINSEVPSRDVPAAWFNKMPVDWSLTPLKFLCRKISGGAVTEDPKIALENIEGWTGRFIETEGVFDAPGIPCKADDILFGKLRPYLAKVFRCTTEMNAVGDLWVLRPSHECDATFLWYMLTCPQFIFAVDATTTGAKMPRAEWQKIGRFKMPTPQIEEQRRIANYLASATERLDTLLAKTERSVELLREHRTALITAAVTGKIDVRNAA